MNSDVNEICNVLHSDYNGVIFDYVDNSDIKETFKYVATKFKDGDKGNIPLLNIIYNYFNGVLPSPKYISGPMSLTYQTSSKYDMKIYIFGENHGTTNTCTDLDLDKLENSMNISHYLQKVFLNSDKFIDFYLEDELFRTIQPNPKQDFMNLLRYDFDNCLNPYKRSKCSFKTVRTHFVDTRRVQKGYGLIGTNPVEKFIYDLSFRKGKRYGHKMLVKKLLKFNSYQEIVNFILELAINIPIIKKELEKCILDKELIISFFRDIMLEWYPTIFTINKWKSIFIKDNDDKEMMDALIFVQAPIVDIYTISRMFKTFKKTENFPDKPRYIIYYAGNTHSMIVRKFLEKLKFKEHIQRSSSLAVRCLNIENIKLNFI
jgi:hypothetical protein